MTVEDPPRSDPAALERSRSELRWRSRRGMLELELLLAPFVSARLDGLTADGLRGYAALLESEDWDVFEWLQGREPPPSEHRAIVGEIRAFLATRKR